MKKILLLAVLLCSFQLLKAQDSAYKFTINHLALCVKDVNRSAGFYAGVLKLHEITNRSKVEGIRWFSLGEGKELHLISVIKENFVLNKAIHLGLTLPDFDAFVLMLQKMQVPYSDWPGVSGKVTVRADGIKQIYLQDPDGYWIEVNSTAQQ